MGVPILAYHLHVGSGRKEVFTFILCYFGSDRSKAKADTLLKRCIIASESWYKVLHLYNYTRVTNKHNTKTTSDN